MPAVVTRPDGVVERVSGELEAYYRAEATRVAGYVIVDDPVSTVSYPAVYAPPAVPAKSAHKAEWVDYARTLDTTLTAEAADGMTIDELIAASAPQLVEDEPVKADSKSARKTQDSTSPES